MSLRVSICPHRPSPCLPVPTGFPALGTGSLTGAPPGQGPDYPFRRGRGRGLNGPQPERAGRWPWGRAVPGQVSAAPAAGLVRMLSRWEPTVPTLMYSWAAICAWVLPRATRVTSSCSRTELAQLRASVRRGRDPRRPARPCTPRRCPSSSLQRAPRLPQGCRFWPTSANDCQ